ncbi:hypothetical protein ACOSQ3_017698 [Xanthoceras sorbifolium]
MERYVTKVLLILTIFLLVAQARRMDNLEANNGDNMEGNGGKIHGNGINNNLNGWGADFYRSASKEFHCWFRSCDTQVVN